MSHITSEQVTFLFTDIEGSTRRWELLPAAMGVALARHDTLLRSAIEAHGGRVFKTVGDAFCAAFASPLEATAAAADAQSALNAEPWGEIGPIRVRMALHTGDPERRDADYFGPPLNRVARLLATGFGEQILVSVVTASLVRDRLPGGTELLDLGSHRLKDLLQPERVYQLVVPGLAVEFPSLKSLDRQPHNLPAQPNPLVGRESEVSRLKAAVAQEGARLVTLTGPGGTGKTRLALQAAAELVESFPDGAWFVGLAPVADPALVPAAVSRPFGIRETGHEPLEETLLHYLRDKRLLLVLDNVEHVLAAAPLVGRLRDECPHCALLSTSRAALRVYGEREFPVSPLALPDPTRLPPATELAEVEAIALFVARAHAVRPEFALTEANAPAVTEICARLDGLPLAIELAAARVRALAPEDLLARLTSRLRLLTGGPADRDERQRTLRGAIAWSHDLLTPSEQMLFRRIAPFTGGGTVAAVEAICSADGAVDALDGVESLIVQSLLRQEVGTAGESRVAMLETIREFAEERLEESGEDDAVRRAHVDFFLALAEAAEPALWGPEQAAWLGRLEDERDNLRAALAWSLDRGTAEAETGLRLATALSMFWWLRGPLSEGSGRLAQALALSGKAPAALRLRALGGASGLAYQQGDLSRTIAFAEEMLALAREVGDAASTSRSLEQLAVAAQALDDHARAVRLYEELQAVSLERGDPQGEATANLGLGWSLHARGDHVTAAARFAAALDGFRRLGDHNRTAMALLLDALAGRDTGALGPAAVRFREAIVLLAEIGDTVHLVGVVAGLASAAAIDGRSASAARLFGAAEALSEAVGAPFPTWFPPERARCEKAIADARTALGAAAFSVVWDAGRALPQEAAIAEALALADEIAAAAGKSDA